MSGAAIYIAGPMTGKQDLNFPLFHREAARLRADGWTVVNPAEINPDPAAGWLACMREAFEAVDVAPEVRAMLDPAFSAMCQGLRNDARPS